MHATNPDWITPYSLRKDAEVMERTAKRYEAQGAFFAAIGLRKQAEAKRLKAAEVRTDVDDTLEAANELAERRRVIHNRPCTTLNPYGE